MVGSILFVFFWNFFGILLKFFGNALGILWEFSIFKVSGLFTLLKSADILHSKSQLITKSYLNMEGIELFVKILGLRKGRKEGRRRRRKK